ncbi:uroporphyrinogen-III synthase [uncultured Sulfitobacter sp.]|uniref:uroporphyrinogen-III synthase n=1 Tax=uncultured Sulfitobacter sp. TaxID=191468 RepID=UPI002616E8F2|nr:uroporphyrinogen-III synthase [uncultured Sulfitobacter sp.]
MSLPTLLLTRPRGASCGFVAALEPAARKAVQVLIAPLMEITSVGAKPVPEEIQGAIFTSANGVDFGPEGQGRLAFCVGARTTAEARRRGWDAEQAGRTAIELIAALRKVRPSIGLVHLSGEHTIGDIADTLTADGIETVHVPIYQQNLLPLEPAARQALAGPCIIPVFSHRTAKQLRAEASGLLEFAHIIALSDSIAAPFEGEKLASCVILPSPQTIYMRKAVETLCLNLSLA